MRKALPVCRCRHRSAWAIPCCPGSCRIVSGWGCCSTITFQSPDLLRAFSRPRRVGRRGTSRAVRISDVDGRCRFHPTGHPNPSLFLFLSSPVEALPNPATPAGRRHAPGCACWSSASCANTVIRPTCRTRRCKPCCSRPRRSRPDGYRGELIFKANSAGLAFFFDAPGRAHSRLSVAPILEGLRLGRESGPSPSAPCLMLVSSPHSNGACVLPLL